MTGTIPDTIELAAGRTIAWIILRTVDDSVEESTSSISGSVESGTGYLVGNPSLAGVLVLDNDRPLPLPPAPSNFSAAGSDRSSVSLSWGAVAGTSRYWVEYRASGSSQWITYSQHISRTTVRVAGLACGAGYNFRIRALGDGAAYRYAWGAAAALTGRTALCLAPAPSGLTAASPSRSSVSLSWNAVAGAHRYRVERSVPGVAGGWTIVSAAVSGTRYVAPGLDCNTLYSFRVRARGDGSTYATVFGDPSAIQSRRTALCPAAPPPTGFAATGATRTTVSLHWHYSLHKHQYRLERSSAAAGPWTTVAGNIGSTSYTVAGLSCNTGYHFRVSARGDGSPYSNAFGSPSASVARYTAGCGVFSFTPQPLGLGGRSNVWTAPAGVAGVYVDVAFSRGVFKNAGAGAINIRRLSSAGGVLSTLVVDNENDSGALTGAGAGSRIRIDVDNDAFDDSQALVTLNFHAGSDSSGDILARATVQKEVQPYPPANLSATVNAAAGRLTLSWGPGAPRLGAAPDHYQVLIPDPSGAATPRYRNDNVDDSSASTVLAVSTGGWAAGTYTAEVRHCNAVGGCSRAATVSFTVAASHVCANGVVVPHPGRNDGLVADCQILWGAKDTLRGTATTLNWSATTALTAWTGVVVGGAPRRVTRLELSGRQLNGRIPAALGDLAALTRLRLQRNSLTGGIPAELGDLAALTYLSLNGNRLTGPIPAEIGSLSFLRNLWLSENDLSGGIPARLANLGALEEIRLGGNRLAGCPPKVLHRVASHDFHRLGCRAVLLGDVAAPLYPGQRVSFTVQATGLAASTRYTIALRATTSAAVDDRDIGFDAACSDAGAAKTLTIPAGRTQYASGPLTLYACGSAGGGGTVDAELRSGTGTGTVLDTDSRYVAVRPVTVAVEVSDFFPATYTPTEESLEQPLADRTIMTAVVDGPAGAVYTYRWQKRWGDTWSTVRGTAAEKPVWFDNRGTRIYRVQATHNGRTATSEEVYVTWDATEIVVDLLTAVRSRVSGATAYQNAERLFLDCVERRAGTRPASFDAVLTQYAGAMKTAAEACEAEGAAAASGQPALAPTTMFATHHRLSREAFAALSGTSWRYRVLLASPVGRDFDANATSPEVVKRYAIHMARESGTAAARSAASTGFNCIPSRAPTSLAGKLDVLTCLIVETGHEFWTFNNVRILRNRINDPVNWPQYGFLGYGIDECTISPDGPRYACRRHDVAYASLQKFVGREEDWAELDAAWNPRNKYVADSKFYQDIEEYGCQYPNWNARAFCVWRRGMASLYYLGVAKTSFGHRGWPVTVEDIQTAYVDGNPRFRSCASPFLPQVSGLQLDRHGKLRTAEWDFEAGCAVGLDGVQFPLYAYGRYEHSLTVDPGADPSPCQRVNSQISCYYDDLPASYDPYRYLRVRLEPKNRVYGAKVFPSRSIIVLYD